MTDKFTQDVADAAAKAHDDEVYAVEENAQNFESIGCAIAVLQRTDSRRMPANVRKMIYEVRAKLSIAHSILINGVTPDPDVVLKGQGHMQRIGAIADALPTADDATQAAVGRAVRKSYGVPRKLVPKDAPVACNRDCGAVMHMTGGRHRTDCAAYQAEQMKTPPSLGAQLADLRSIIDKVEAARTRIAQRARSFDEVVDRGVRKDLYFDDILDLLVDARQLSIDMRDEVERTLAGKFLTLRDLKVGDCFRFKDPPPGWTDGKLQLTESHPGFAMPPGWDFFPVGLLDGEIERVDGGATLSVTQASPADPVCVHCGVKLTEDNRAGLALGVCGGCE